MNQSQVKEINHLKTILDNVNGLVYNKNTKSYIDQITKHIIDTYGSGNWIGYTLSKCKKSELVIKLTDILNRLITDKNKKIINTPQEVIDPKKDIIKAIHNDTAKFIGEGKWNKDSAYQVYEYNNHYFSVIIHNKQDKWMLDDTITEIKKEEIYEYI